MNRGKYTNLESNIGFLNEIKNYNTVKNKLTNELSRKPLNEEIATEMGIPLEKCETLQNLTIIKDGKETIIEEKEKININNPEILNIADNSYINTINKLDAKLITDIIIKTLNPKERKIIEMRYGLTDGILRNLEEVGKEFGITRERVRQIEAKAIENIKERNHNILSTLPQYNIKNYYPYQYKDIFKVYHSYGIYS